MSFAFLPLFTGDYLRDTRHLTPMKHGVYLLLLMHCWDQKGPLPLDEQDCAGIANCRSADEIDALRYILSKFFVRMDDGWYNERMQAEIERSEALSRKRSRAGKAGYTAMLSSVKKEVSGKSPASAKAIAGQVPLTPTPTLTPIPTPTRSTPLASSDLSLSAESAEKVMEKIPLNDGTEWPVTESLVRELDRLFPAVDPHQTLREIRAWCIGNPTRRKTRGGVKRFIVSWFSREQDKHSKVM